VFLATPIFDSFELHLGASRRTARVLRIEERKKAEPILPETDPDLSRLAQQENWRKRLGSAESAYHRASEELRQAQLRNAQGSEEPGLNDARERKADARREYLRILRVFTDLVLRGKSPSPDEDR
jgi:hypothetical protein